MVFTFWSTQGFGEEKFIICWQSWAWQRALSEDRDAQISVTGTPSCSLTRATHECCSAWGLLSGATASGQTFKLRACCRCVLFKGKLLFPLKIVHAVSFAELFAPKLIFFFFFPESRDSSGLSAGCFPFYWPKSRPEYSQLSEVLPKYTFLLKAIYH